MGKKKKKNFGALLFYNDKVDLNRACVSLCRWAMWMNTLVHFRTCKLIMQNYDQDSLSIQKQVKKTNEYGEHRAKPNQCGINLSWVLLTLNKKEINDFLFPTLQWQYVGSSIFLWFIHLSLCHVVFPFAFNAWRVNVEKRGTLDLFLWQHLQTGSTMCLSGAVTDSYSLLYL